MKRTILTLALAIGLIASAVFAGTKVPSKDVTVNTTSFQKNLGVNDSDVQHALQTIDNITIVSTELDPVWNASKAGYFNKSSDTTDNATQGSVNKYANTTKEDNGQTAYTWGNHSQAGYIKNLTSFTTDDLTQGSTNKYANVTAEGLAHSHANKSVLDSIQEALTTALKSTYDSVVTLVNGNYTTWNAKADYSFGAHNFTGTGNMTSGNFTTTGNVTAVNMTATNFLGSGSALTGVLHTETDPLSLHLDQTTPQTVVNGVPLFNLGIKSPKLYPAVDSTTAVQINKANGTTNVMNIDTTNGRVGIGTVAPSQLLNIVGGTDSSNFLSVDRSDHANCLQVTSGDYDYSVTKADNIYVTKCLGVGYEAVNSRNIPFAVGRKSANTATIQEMLRIATTSTGTVAANFGASIDTYLEDASGNAAQQASSIGTIWTTPTHGAESSAITFSGVTAGGALTEWGRMYGASAGTGGTLEVDVNGIRTTGLPINGLLLNNTAASTAGVTTQFPPAIIFKGSSYTSGANHTVQLALAFEPDTGFSDAGYFKIFTQKDSEGWIERLSMVRGYFTSQLGWRWQGSSESIPTSTGSIYYTTDLATAGTDRYSPPIIMYGQGWKTAAAAGSQSMSLGQILAPEQGNTNPIGVYKMFYGTNAITPVETNELCRYEWGDRLGVDFNKLAIAGYHFNVTAPITFQAAGNGIVLKQGANGKCGTFVLTGVTPVSVANSSIAITDVIMFSLNTVGGTVGAHPQIQTITAGVGFTVSGSALDTSTMNYAIISNAS